MWPFRTSQNQKFHGGQGAPTMTNSITTLPASATKQMTSSKAYASRDYRAASKFGEAFALVPSHRPKRPCSLRERGEDHIDNDGPGQAGLGDELEKLIAVALAPRTRVEAQQRARAGEIG